jgi:twitching motility protein PilT
MHLVKGNLVTYEEALKNVSNPDDFALRFRGIASTSDGTWDDFDKDDEEKNESTQSRVAPGGAGSGAAPRAAAGEAGAGASDLKIERF